MSGTQASGSARLRATETRSLDGTGNNLANDDWGAINQTFTRVAENSYTDGTELMARARALIWEPAGTVFDPDLGRPVFVNSPNDEVPQGRAGPNTPDGRIPLTDDLRFVNQPTGDLPQARDVSNAVFAQPRDANGNEIFFPNRTGANDFALFFGQALTHDTVETQVNVTAVSFPQGSWSGPETSSAILVDGVLVPRAPTLLVDISDPNSADYRTFVDHQVLSKGSPFALQRTPGVYDEQGVRQQANTETAFFDLGNVYGKIATATLDPRTVKLDHPAVLSVAPAADGTSVVVTFDTSILLRRTAEDGRPSAFLLTSNDVADGVRDHENLLPTYGEVNLNQGLFNDLPGTFDPQTGAPINEIQLGMGRVFDPTLEAFFDLDRFAAGDQRVNQNAATITQQTVWMRNHNWHAERLSQQFPEWSSEEVFNAARALNEAEYQKAIYDEYLPAIIGEAGVALMGRYQGYRPDVNPAIINEWTTIAFRFGHDQSSDFVEKLREDGSISERVRLIDSFTRAGNATAVADSNELDEWLRGQLAAEHQRIDGFVVDGNRNQLFGVTVSPVTGQPVTTDLTVFDVVRGRDHGVNSYMKLREALGLETYGSFEAWAADNGVSAERLAALKDLYDNDFARFDAYVGVLLEERWADSQLGITATILTAMQFQSSRDGDRLWYENRFKDNPDILAAIRESSMTEVLQRTTGIEHIYRDAFLAHTRIGGDDAGNHILGTEDRNLMVGLGGDDWMDGRGDRDDLFGDWGNDTLFGGGGDDLLNGGDGDDMLAGGEGNDTLIGGAWQDTVTGGLGDDLFRFAPVADGINVTEVVTDFGVGRDRIEIRLTGSYSVEVEGGSIRLALSTGDAILLEGAAFRVNPATIGQDIVLT